MRETLESNASEEKVAQFELITPQIAIAYLKLNDRHNRKISKQKVAEYVRIIKHGDWKTTHQGIAFLKDGHLGDGQHRLLAIIESGIPVYVMVTRGLTRDDLMAVDRGKTRSVNDVVTMSSFTDDAHTDIMSNSKVISALTQLASCNYKRMGFSASEIKRMMDVFSDQSEFIYENIVTKAYSKNCTAVINAAAIAAMYCGVHKDIILKFYDVFCKADISGCEGFNIRAALNWRRQIDAMKAKHVQIDKTKMFLATQNAIWHFANNTSVSTIKVPAAPRYDVRDQIIRALGITGEAAA